MTSKSITLPPPYKLVIVVCACITITLIQDVVAPQAEKKYKQMEILDDLPLKNDIDKYLISLEKIVLFADKHRLYIDLNFSFGLFLINVNLRTIYLMKGIKLPTNVKTRLENVLKVNDELMKFFKEMVKKFVDETGSESPLRYITEVFADGETSWSNHLQKFRTDLLKKTKFYSKRELKQIYSKWPKYTEKVFDFESYFPNPAFSDTCISSLSQIPVNHKMQWVNCKITHSCVKIVLNGTEYGYGITHRLLYLIMARFARGCTVISGSQDKHNLDQFCAKIYNEAEYLAQHNFDIVDLAMEQISLCALEGHVQFLRRSWLDDLLDFQNVVGCFGASVDTKDEQPPAEAYELERPKWELINDDQEIMGRLCNSHTSGVAAGVLSAAIRYIIEKFY